MMRSLIVALLMTNCFYSISQTPHFRKHTLPIEFKSATIQCIVQDKNHFIWLGTSIGLVRFDGTSYKYYVQFPGGENSIQALLEDSNGSLWIGYKDGTIGKLHHNRFIGKISRTKDAITDFAEDSLHNIWASTYGSGIIAFNENDTLTINAQSGLPDNFVYTIVATNSGKVFAGTDQGVVGCSFKYNEPVQSITNTQNGLPDNIVTTLLVEPSGRILVGTESEGICRLDPVTGKISNIASNWQYGRVNIINVFDKITWIGTAMHGIVEVSETGAVRKLQVEDTTIPLKISDLVTDSEGNIWVASGANFVLSAHRMFSFFKPYELNNEPIQSVLSSGDGTLWWSTNSGLFFQRKGERVVEKVSARALIGAQVINLYEDEHGLIWCGTFDKGVLVYDPVKKGVVSISEKNGLINNNVLSIAGKGNELWFATLGGVSKCIVSYLKPSVAFDITNYTSEHGLGSNYIYKVFIDSKGRVWFTTDGKGVTMLEGGKFRNFSLEEGLKSNIVYSVTEDATGRIWVSTANAGVFRFDGNSFQAFTPHNGLRDLSISSIVGEKNGKILIVSKQGLDLLDPATGAVFYHGEEFGIGAMDPNLNAYAYDSVGNVWFGTDKGIVYYNANIRQMNKWPVTRINDVQLFLSSTDTTVHEFPHNQNHISFDYKGFWYHDAAEVTYQLKLDGYDREWIDSKNNFITYPDLAPGDYNFQVKSSATNHFDGAPVTNFRFRIASPFYNTIPFYILSISAIAMLMYWIVKTRERRLKTRERLEKEKIQFQFETLKNQVNPHFLFNSFNTLIGVIEEQPQEAVEYVEKLSDFYRDIIVNREKDVITLETELTMINNYYFLQLKRFKANFEIKISVDNAAMKRMIPPLTLQLLVENAIKHNIISADKPLTVWISTDNDYVIVKNNLQKKVVYEPSTGLGLANIINRINLLTDREVKVEETASHFVVHVPLINQQAK